ncbi:hypothetical protein KP509_03G097700 [Ceratopteris richardii]|uniref:STI1/HOP DP domain-containing protein n=1 Tax=Ceratopteris richardii TaxID=49495 RepID=A0A8T2V2D3_CERRI|nr:hypothetical protein KP509_03G097700 [Ceratopteris richardii]
MADEAKAKGNAAFSAGKFEEAIKHFSDAIALSPTNHVLFSNRSASYASIHKYQEALDDAQKTVELKPDWVKGYSRLGAAYVGLGKFDDAESAYKKGLELDPSNEGLKSGLSDVVASKSRTRAAPPSPFGDIFSGPDLFVKLTQDPRTRPYLQQPDFVQMLNDVQKNPSHLNLYLKDQRMMQVLGVLLGIGLQTWPKDGEESFPDEKTEKTSQAAPPPTSSSSKKSTAEVKEASEPEPMDIFEDDKEKKKKKAEAIKEKEAGNAAYKKKDFSTAIEHYTKAIELDDEDISYITNRAAVYLEMGKVC